MVVARPLTPPQSPSALHSFLPFPFFLPRLPKHRLESDLERKVDWVWLPGQRAAQDFGPIVLRSPYLNESGIRIHNPVLGHRGSLIAPALELSVVPRAAR